METLTHEGKTYIKQPAIDLCIGCDFCHTFESHSECHAPAEAICDGIIYKETNETDDEQDEPTQAEITAFVISILILILFIIGIIALVSYILFIK